MRQGVVKPFPGLGLNRQCEVLQIHRSDLYYKPRGESTLNLQLMPIIDRKFLGYPYYGVQRMDRLPEVWFGL